MLYIIGLGVSDGDLSVNAYKKLKSASCVILRTDRTRAAEFLKREGIAYTSLDYLYEKSRNFDTLKRNLVSAVKESLKTQDVCYVVDGAVSEDTCSAALIKSVKETVVFESASKTSAAISSFGLSGEKYTAISAYDLNSVKSLSFPLVVYDLDDFLLASEWKLKLSKFVGDDRKVGLYVDNRTVSVPLYELDEDKTLFNYSTVLVIKDEKLEKKERFDFNDLLEIVEVLRSENGCPWDKAQTMLTIRKNLIEECYELVDAVTKDDDEKILEETGDVLLQAAFYIIFEEERGFYDRTDFLSGICSKLIFRHTHVFGADKATDAESALRVWSKNKLEEKGFSSLSDYVGDVPSVLPACMRASKTVKRGMESGLNFTKDELAERIKTLAESLKIIEENAVGASGGELLLDAVALVKTCGGDPEQNLTDATERYIANFQATEEALKKEGLNIKTADPEKVKSTYYAVKKS